MSNNQVVNRSFNLEEKQRLLDEFNTTKNNKLVASIALDAVGMLSYAIPGFAELGDLVWGPIAGIATFVMYRGFSGFMAGGFEAAEEMLPFTDAIPGVSMMWVYKYKVRKKATFAAFLKDRKTEAEMLLMLDEHLK